MAFTPIRRTRLNQSMGDGIDWVNPLKLVVAFNFAEGVSPRNLARPSLGSWSHSGTAPTKRVSPLGIGASNGAAASSYSTYGGWRALDGFSPANSPACFVFSFAGGTYVSNGSSSNIIFSYGAPDSAVGFYAYVNSSNQLRITLANTNIGGPTITATGKYHCVAGRDSAGNCWLWVNGALVVSGTGATAADSASERSLQVHGDGTGVRAFSGTLHLLCIGSGNPGPFGAQLSANPGQVFL